MSGKGCLSCGNASKGLKLSNNLEDFLRQAKSLHSNYYDYSRVVYKNNGTKVTIICPIHGEFFQTPQGHCSGRGCMKCSLYKKSLGRPEFIRRSTEKFGAIYDYSKVDYHTLYEKVIITCPIHGDFKLEPTYHLQGYGCKKCGSLSREVQVKDYLFHVRSKVEEHALHYMLSNPKLQPGDIYGEYSKQMPKIPLSCGHIHRPDFYIPKHNALVEVKNLGSFGVTEFYKIDPNITLSLNQRKSIAAKKLGYKYILLLFHRNKRIRLPENWENFKRKELRVEILNRI